jgi:hypothetical protein
MKTTRFKIGVRIITDYVVPASPPLSSGSAGVIVGIAKGKPPKYHVDFGDRKLWITEDNLILKNSGDPYNSAPTKPDPWAQVPVKKVRSRNPHAYVIYAQRKHVKKAPLMWFDGKKFTNDNAPHLFGTHDRARGKAQLLVKQFSILSGFKVYVGGAYGKLLKMIRRKNPESLDEAARRLEDFSGHAPQKTIRVRARSNQTTGLVIGELDLIGYRTKRDGIAGDKLLRYAHDFSKGSRPLLAVSSDGKQLHIVGGQYEFTEAGIEDR